MTGSLNRPAYPTLREATWVWARIAALSFGGPAGQIALMHRILVEEKRWLGDGRFLHALNFCMILPGPEAQQLATYIGWLLHRTWGGVVAGVLFILPGAVAIMALSIIYALYGEVGLVNGLFYGVKAAVLAIVMQALFRIGGRALRNNVMLGIAGLSSERADAIVNLLLLWPAVAVSAKRWQDRNRSPWWVLVALVPVVGWLWALLDNGFVRGTPGINRFGAPPER
jgi:chromate transport protein ChrA